jgi:hypothetical protein
MGSVSLCFITAAHEQFLIEARLGFIVPCSARREEKAHKRRLLLRTKRRRQNA